MAGIVLKQVCKIYPNGVQAVKDFDFSVKDGEYLVLMGPSGCGKSTLLRMIAGLEETTSGTILMDGQDVTDKDPRDRNVAMVFKNSVLYPGMTVGENLEFALRMARMPQTEIERRVAETSKAAGIEEILDKSPSRLSEADKRKVLLARAVVKKPGVLLLDGILSGIGLEERIEVGKAIISMRKELGATIIHVTDDRVAAGYLASRTVVMKDGMIIQADTPSEILDHPLNKFVAGSMGMPEINFFRADVKKSGRSAEVDFEGCTFKLKGQRSACLLEKGYEGSSIFVGIRPIDMNPVTGHPKKDSVILTAKITDKIMVEKTEYWEFENDESSCLCNSAEMDVETGSEISIEIDPEKIHLFDGQTGLRIIA